MTDLLIKMVAAFGIYDNKKREIGALVYTWQHTAPRWYGDTQVVGFYYFRPQAMRGGETFGACKPPQGFRTEAERDAAVAKYFRGARERAHKNFPG